MVDKMADGHELRQFNDTPVMVGVKMRNQQIVDRANARFARSRHDPVCVP
jgi:hypothetical protein